MKSKAVKATIASAVTISAIGLQAPIAATAAEGDFELTILHTNDTHAHLENVAKRVTVVEQLRAENPNNLLLDAGDVFSGTLYFNEFEGQADLAFMNLLQYDAMTFGNHEFDLGASPEGHAALAEFIAGAEFPFVSANTDFSQDTNLAAFENNVYTSEFENGEIYSGIIKEIDGEQVGIFGLTTEETADISSPGEVDFSNYIAAAEEAVAAFEAAGVNKIVALTHLGYDDSRLYDNDRLLAEAVAGIDVIVGGHTHTELGEPIVFNEDGEPVVIVQAGQYGNAVGELDVTFNEAGVITSFDGTLHPVGSAVADAEAAELLAPYTAAIERLKNQSTGAEAEVVLNGARGDVRTSETNLGNLITDGMLATAQEIDPETVIALQNGGGIRASIDTGDITVGEVLTVMPFGNSLAIMELSGAEIIAALEHSVSAYPTTSGGFLQVAGLKFAFDPTAPAGERISEVYITSNDEVVALDPAAFYKVATNTFTAKGGDGYDVFAAAYADGRVSEPGNIDYQMFIDYIATLGKVSPEVEGRINLTVPYADISILDEIYPYVQNLYYNGLLDGLFGEEFEADKALKQGEAVALAVRAAGIEAATVEEAIAAAVEAGILSDGKFQENKAVKRAGLALLLNRAFDYAGDDYVAGELAPFKDLKRADAETQKAITMLYDFGIVEGHNGQFKLNAAVSHAEAVKIVSLFLDELK
ncbi:bifunctional metallophosphatase/5'-nucleotidase [Planococcus lenghuensis]|uniref:Multifunctional 2',3'-cyclic-nucleotide 2'-phosphodiesterase/5'-nucleotidase/3'-nucleotidase n=1 Tax=Planococcus lenghuensis TaxID=2213202 RepID=A0A1Q2L2Y1_9BACL|nr:5'-nucleotidase C-terminal domain-containing protein [Planococcus lenghuensis]AQQ54242.1 multifunctional 2',3'-cyclic-nucleotide 2'-phosphodiesterase/5'-nucleotidase/3'-nucleotidase [Planococcus lenghuensis]